MSFKALTASLPQQPVSGSVSLASIKSPPPLNFPGPADWAAKQEKTSPDYASERAQLLFGCYPRGQANDPDTYVMAVAAVLCRFPPEVTYHLTDPRTGVATTAVFLPTIAEIIKAGERSTLMVWAPKFREAKEAQQRMLADGGQNTETRAQPIELR